MNCIFCKIINKEIPSSILYEDEDLIAIMDINPVCDGHVLIIPKEHFETIFDLPSDLLHKMYEVAYNIGKKQMNILNEDGLTLIFNYGSRQEIKHAHLHVLPKFGKEKSMEVNDVYNMLMEK